jgi:hypothetical protein
MIWPTNVYLRRKGESNRKYHLNIILVIIVRKTFHYHVLLFVLGIERRRVYVCEEKTRHDHFHCSRSLDNSGVKGEKRRVSHWKFDGVNLMNRAAIDRANWLSMCMLFSCHCLVHSSAFNIDIYLITVVHQFLSHQIDKLNCPMINSNKPHLYTSNRTAQSDRKSKMARRKKKTWKKKEKK